MTYPTTSERSILFRKAVTDELKLYDYKNPFCDGYAASKSQDDDFCFEFTDERASLSVEITIDVNCLGKAIKDHTLYEFYLLQLDLRYELPVPTSKLTTLLGTASDAVAKINRKLAGIAQNVVKSSEEFAKEAQEILRTSVVVTHGSKVRDDKPYCGKAPKGLTSGRVRFLSDTFDVEVIGLTMTISVVE